MGRGPWRKAGGAAWRPVKRLLRRLFGTPLEEMPDPPILFRQYRRLARHPELERRPGGWLYRGRFYPDYLTAGGKGHAIARIALRHCRGRGVDVGAGVWPLPGSEPIDIERGPGVGRSLDEFPDDSLDFVFSSHCLEHIEDWRAALAAWTAKLKPGGVLFLYLPHAECAMWHPGSPFVGSAHRWAPSPGVVREAVLALGCEPVEWDDGPDAMESFYLCARRCAAGSDAGRPAA